MLGCFLYQLIPRIALSDTVVKIAKEICKNQVQSDYHYESLNSVETFFSKEIGK